LVRHEEGSYQDYREGEADRARVVATSIIATFL